MDDTPKSPATEEVMQTDEQILFDLSPDLIAVTNFEGYFIKLNSQWSTDLGWTSEELMQAPFIDFVHPEDRDVTAKVAASLTSGSMQSLVNFENRYRCKDGSYKWLNWTATVNYKTQKYYSISRIVDAQKDMQLELIELKQAIEHSHDIIFRTDLDGFIKSINKSFTDLYGYTFPEVEGQTPRILKSGKQTPEFYKEFWAKVTNGELVQHDIINRTKAGHYVHIETTVSAVYDDAQRIVGYMAIQRDISRRLEEQRELIAKTRELQQLNKLMVGRELKMIELKTEINKLKNQYMAPGMSKAVE